MKDSLFIQNQSALTDILQQADSIGIVVGQQNLDTMGAALGLYLSLESAGRHPQIVSKKDPIVEISNLVGIDRVKRSFDGVVRTLTISVPYREGEIEKVSYNIEGDRLNVNLFAESNGINFHDSDVRFIKKGSAPTVIIAVGVQDIEELQSVTDVSGAKIVNVDNSGMNSFYGDVVFVDPSFSSVSEIVVKMLTTIAFPMDVDSAQNLMDGLSYATRNFTIQSTSPFAFEAAGLLLQEGAARKSGEQRSHGQRRQDNRDFVDHFMKDRRNDQRPRGQGNPRQQQQRIDQPRNDQPRNDQPRQVQPQVQVQSQPEEQVQDAQVMDSQDTMQDEVPSDWFVPKVFKGSKAQGE